MRLALTKLEIKAGWEVWRHYRKVSYALNINNRKLEDQIKEILQCTSYASAEECLVARITMDHLAVKRGKKLQ